MNGWFIAAGALLAAAFFVHVLSGNRFYSLARPGRGTQGAYEAWLMGRCGFQMIAVDLALGAAFVLLLGFGILPRNPELEIFLFAAYAGWALFWLVSLACEKSEKRLYLRLGHWGLFLVAALLLGLGMRS